MLHTILSNPESVATTLMLIFWSLLIVCVGFPHLISRTHASSIRVFLKITRLSGNLLTTL